MKSYTYKIVSNESSTSDSSIATDTTTSDDSSNVTDTITQVVTTDTDNANDTSSDKTASDTGSTSGSTGSDTSTGTGTTDAGSSENTGDSGSSSGSGETGSGSNESGNDSGESESGDTEDSGEDDDTAKYTATFTTDGHATINIYYTQDYTTADETNVTTAVARDSNAGSILSDGNGQINFMVVVDDGYKVSDVTVLPETNYKNLKNQDENNNIYRITKVTGDITVTVTTAEKVKEDVTNEAPVSIKDDSDNVIYIYSDGTSYTADINSAGEYQITGDSDNIIENLNVNINTTDEVTLDVSDVSIDNDEGVSVITSSLAANVRVNLSGTSTVKGTFSNIDAKNGTLTITGEGTLNVDTSEMYNQTDDEGYDGIVSKGAVVVESGTVNVTSSGDCIKGSNGGITINGGTLNLSSGYASALKSKNSEIVITGGTVTLSTDEDDAIKAYDKSDITTSHKVTISGGDINITKSGGYGIRSVVVNVDGADTKLTIANTAEDGIRAKASETLSGTTLATDNNGTGVVTIDNGTITMTGIQGDGIQAEYLNINDGTINIKTAYDYAGTNFYASNNVSGSSYNSVSNNNSTETINYDTGSHKGFKVGTKAKTFRYNSVATGSSYTAGTTYTQTASGLLKITGGKIDINTTATGIKFNAGNDNQTIIGSPDDGIKANYKANISGGTITINASDDGICAVEELDVTDQAVIDIQTAYEGIEGKTIKIGTNGDSSITYPSVSVYTNDDGINASAKTLSYVYADEDETTYTKTKTSQSKVSSTTIYSGYVYVMIGDDKTHSVSLTSTNGDKYSNSYSSMGDGIDCNGSMYAYGGKTVVFGMTSGSESPIDMDTNFECGAGATMLLVGADTMGETSKISTSQGYIVYGSSSSTGFGGKGGGNQSSSSLSTGNYQILSGSTELESFTLSKTAVYLLYTSPSVKSGSSYTLKGTSSTSLTAK